MTSRNKATQERNIIELQVHRSNLERGHFTRADAIRLVDGWLGNYPEKSDPFLRGRSISRLMGGAAVPEDFESAQHSGG